MGDGFGRNVDAKCVSCGVTFVTNVLRGWGVERYPICSLCDDRGFFVRRDGDEAELWKREAVRVRRLEKEPA